MTTPSTASLLDQLQAERDQITDAHQLADWVRRVNTLTADIREARWTGYPWQTPHAHEDEWISARAPGYCDDDCLTRPPVRIPTHGMWLMLGGRGTGKTEGAARYMNDHVKGPACDDRLPGGHRMLIVAPTQGDAMDACYAGPSGLKTLNPAVRLYGGTGGTAVLWPTADGRPGARARLLGAYSREDIERLRSAGNTCLVWMEEVAAQRNLAAALQHTEMGLRIGTHPHYVGSTTPKPRTELRTLIADPRTVTTKGRTRDAIHLDPTVLQSYLDRWEGTRAGQQELDAVLLDDVEGALWTYAIINDHRWVGPLPALNKIIVGVDPPGSHKDPSAEAGIVVVGAFTPATDHREHGIVLADLSGTMTPEEWSRTAVDAALTWGAVGLAVETTYGGDMVVSTVRTRNATIPIFPMPTKVGKRLRAEPVVGLYEQGRMHHYGSMPGLETQQTSWVDDDTMPSPDRIDALVHAATYLLIKAVPGLIGNPARSPVRIPGR
jgi:phage terminase large subunit-like protein